MHAYHTGADNERTNERTNHDNNLSYVRPKSHSDYFNSNFIFADERTNEQPNKRRSERDEQNNNDDNKNNNVSMCMNGRLRRQPNQPNRYNPRPTRPSVLQTKDEEEEDVGGCEEAAAGRHCELQTSAGVIYCRKPTQTVIYIERFADFEVTVLYCNIRYLTKE